MANQKQETSLQSHSMQLIFHPVGVDYPFQVLLWIQTFHICNFVHLYSAAQMWNLAVYLPFFIGDKVPEDDPHWECYLLLLEILWYCTAKVTCKPSTMYLASLIEEHHRTFCLCYPATSLTPKFHYIVHLPRLMLEWVEGICFMLSHIWSVDGGVVPKPCLNHNSRVIGVYY